MGVRGLGHVHLTGSLRIEDEGREFASQVERKTLSDEDSLPRMVITQGLRW